MGIAFAGRSRASKGDQGIVAPLRYGGPETGRRDRSRGCTRARVPKAGDCSHEHRTPPTGHRPERHHDHRPGRARTAAAAGRTRRAGAAPGRCRAPGGGRPQRPAGPRAGHLSGAEGVPREVVGVPLPLSDGCDLRPLPNHPSLEGNPKRDSKRDPERDPKRDSKGDPKQNQVEAVTGYRLQAERPAICAMSSPNRAPAGPVTGNRPGASWAGRGASPFRRVRPRAA
jgi:hypothetical protein